MNCAIFIRSYQNDFPWLSYCLRSLAKFSSGFSEIVIVVPNGHQFDLRHLTAERVIAVHDGQPGYLCQQADKLNADIHCPNADFILHVDSDMVFTRPFSPEYFLRDGKAVWAFTEWGNLPGQTEKKPWFHVMAKALQECPPHEFMRRCALMVPRWLYGDFREHLLSLHNLTMTQYVMNQPGNEFSEYNCLGFFAWLKHHEKFYWHDTRKEGHDWPFIQNWSWGGLTDEIRDEIEDILN